MTQETRIALVLVGELLTELRANDPETFKRWLAGRVEDLKDEGRRRYLAD